MKNLPGTIPIAAAAAGFGALTLQPLELKITTQVR